MVFGNPCVLSCEVHVAAIVGKHLFTDEQDNLTGMIRLAMSLQLGAYMHRFRLILRRLVVSDFTTIRVGTPPGAAVAHRFRVLQLFGGHGRKAVEKLIALSLLPNGDWKQTDRIVCVAGRPTSELR